MGQAKTLNDSELKIVLAVLAQGRNKQRNRLMILLSHWGGMRVGEIAALKVGNVTDPAGEVVNEIRLLPEQTKGARGRSVMLGDKLRREIKAYLDTLKVIIPEQPLIYSQKSRNGFSSNSLSQEFKKIYNLAGLAGATSHSGRRTFITNLANKGIGVKVLMTLAGHRSIATTQLYIDVNDEMLKAAVNLL